VSKVLYVNTKLKKKKKSGAKHIIAKSILRAKNFVFFVRGRGEIFSTLPFRIVLKEL